MGVGAGVLYGVIPHAASAIVRAPRAINRFMVKGGKVWRYSIHILSALQAKSTKAKKIAETKRIHFSSLSNSCGIKNQKVSCIT
ncbi:MAG: hypothetical protein A2Z97_08880 [Bdellovibrionales bacterium GWB1_52_6]|nr:MAG: hypothetical protein A2Z97_08880 [Bdellovibrionales bacterium GWB1_52_6]